MSNEPVTSEERKIAIQSLNIITGFWKSRAVSCAASLNIADHLSEKPMPLNELAQKTGTNSIALQRLLQALCSIGYFKEGPEKHYTITPLGATLKANAKNSLKYTAICFACDEYPAWITLEETVKTGKSGFLQMYGVRYYEYLKENPEDFENFNHMLKEFTRLFHQNITSYYDFSQFKHIIDIGGNDGEFLLTILEKIPGTIGTVFDLPHVIEVAKKRVAQSKVKDRVSFAAGNFLESVPRGGDCYMIKFSIGDWLDDDAMKIFQNVKKHMKNEDKFLVIQSVIPSGNGEHPGKWTDLAIQVFLNGIERTRQEMEQMCCKVGMKLLNVIPTEYSIFDIVEICI